MVAPPFEIGTSLIGFVSTPSIYLADGRSVWQWFSKFFPEIEGNRAGGGRAVMVRSIVPRFDTPFALFSWDGFAIRLHVLDLRRIKNPSHGKMNHDLRFAFGDAKAHEPIGPT